MYGRVHQHRTVRFMHAAPSIILLCLTALAHAQAPANDRCSNARNLGQAAGSFAFDLTHATTTPGEGQMNPICDQYDLGPSIPTDMWFRWTAPSAGYVLIATISDYSTQDIDTKLAVYNGFSCTGPILACNEDEPTGLYYFSEVGIAVSAGQQLLIQVGMSPDPYTDPGPAFLSIQLAGPPPANDECSAPVHLGSLSGPFAFDLSSATTGVHGQAGAQCDDPEVLSDLWFTWTAPAAGLYSIATRPSPLAPDQEPDTKLIVYAGTICPAESTPSLGCNDDDEEEGSFLSRVQVQLLAGQSVLIQLGRSPYSEDPFITGEFTIAPVTKAANDECAGAIDLGGMIGEIPFDLTTATTSPTDHPGLAGCPFSDAVAHDVWYRWTSPCAGSVVLSTVGLANGLDTRIAVYRTASCGTPSPTACNDDAFSDYDWFTLESSTQFTASLGEVFLIRIGTTPQTPAGKGAFSLACTTLPPCPPDFNLDGAIGTQDIFDFLSAWFLSSPAADFNHDGDITVQDIFDFLAAWFHGRDACKPHCPTFRGMLALRATTVLLLWNDLSSDELAFVVTIRAEGGDETKQFVPRGSTGVGLAGLASDTAYVVDVRSKNLYGESLCSAHFEFRTLKPVDGLAASPLCRGVQLSWNLNVDDADAVRIAISRDGGQNWDNAAEIDPGTYSTVIQHLSPERDYWFKARVRTPDGYTIYSDAVHVRTNHDCVMNAPTNCIAARDSSTLPLDVVITWINNAPGATGVRVSRSVDRLTWSSIAEVGPAVTSVRDADPALEPNARYYYRVRAVYRGQDGTYYSPYSNTDYAFPVAPNIDPPTVCVASRDSTTPETDVLISWNDNSDNESGFEIERSTDQTSWTRIRTASAGTTSIRDSDGLVPSTLYYYRVRAFATAGGDTFHSGYSNTDSAFPVAPNIGAPFNCLASRDNTTAELDVIITWSDASDNETGFEILRSTDQVNWATAGITGPNVQTFRDVWCGLMPEVLYSYRVRATLQAGHESFASGVSNIDTSLIPTPVIAAPTIVSADRDRQTPAVDVVVTWVDHATNETEYSIERRTDPGTYAQIATVGANQTTYRDSAGLTTGTRYFYRVRAVLRTPCHTFYSGYSGSDDANP